MKTVASRLPFHTTEAGSFERPHRLISLIYATEFFSLFNENELVTPERWPPLRERREQIKNMTQPSDNLSSRGDARFTRRN